jgi:Tol biopolymer transport system component/DNA-binding winged helix-turn-helix (wHTH) protein
MSEAPAVYTFGPFRVDSGEHVVMRDGQLVPLTPKALAILLALLQRRGHVVEKAELMGIVWPDTVVEEGNLTQGIYSLRKLLGPPGDGGISIETIPRRGYRLVGNVEVVADGLGVRDASPVSRRQVSVAARLANRRVWQSAVLIVVSGALLLIGRSVTTTRRDSTLSSNSAAVLEPRPVHSLPGDKITPALSSDGERIAFVWDAGDGHNLYVAQAGREPTLQLTRGPGGKSFPTWAPDGRSIAYIHRFLGDDGKGVGGIFVVSATGGPARLLWRAPQQQVGQGLDWSPDGRHLVLSAKQHPTSPHQVALLSIDGGDLRWLTAPSDSDTGDRYPVFSPTGDSIAFVRGRQNESRIVLLSPSGGASRELPVTGHDIRRLAWTANGGSIVFSSRVGQRLWSVSVDGDDEARPLPGLGEGAMDPAIARRQGRLVFRHQVMDQNIYRVAFGSDTPAKPVSLAPTIRDEASPSISPDASRIAFVSSRTGTREVWVMQSDGSRPTQLTDLRTLARHPRWSADGRYLAFSADAAGSSEQHIYVVEASGGMARRLTSGPSLDQWPFWSHDGAWVYFSSNRAGVWDIWKVPSGGGDALRLTTDSGVRACESLDGQFLYYSAGGAIWRRPLPNGQQTLVMHLPPDTGWGGEWTVAVDGIYWMNESHREQSWIEFYDFGTRKNAIVYTPPARYDTGGGFSLSPKRDWLVFGQREYESADILIVDGIDTVDTDVAGRARWQAHR